VIHNCLISGLGNFKLPVTIQLINVGYITDPIHPRKLGNSKWNHQIIFTCEIAAHQKMTGSSEIWQHRQKEISFMVAEIPVKVILE